MPLAAQRRPNLSLLLPVCKESLWRGLGYILLRDGYPSSERRTFLVSHCSLSIAIISMNSIFPANPGTRVPRFPVCGCKGTTKNQYQPNISATFFQENFAKITKTSHISNLPPQNFYAVKHIFPTHTLSIYPKNRHNRQTSSKHQNLRQSSVHCIIASTSNAVSHYYI